MDDAQKMNYLWRQIQSMIHYDLVEPILKEGVPLAKTITLDDITGIRLTDNGKRALGRDERSKQISKNIQTFVKALEARDEILRS